MKKVSFVVFIMLLGIIVVVSPAGLSVNGYPDSYETGTPEMEGDNSNQRFHSEVGEFGRSEGPKTLLVSTDREEYGEPFTLKLAVWLRAVFSADVRMVEQNELTGDNLAGILDGIEVIIYYGTDYGRPPSQEFIDYAFGLLEAGATKLVWIGYHGNKLSGYLEEYGMEYRGLKTNDTPPAQALYVDTKTTYEVSNRDLVVLESVNPELSRVRTTIEGIPLVLSGHNRSNHTHSRDSFYFFGFHPTAYVHSGGGHLIFLDLMHEVYEIKRSKYALVRLEDVNPSINPGELSDVTQYLMKAEKPFIISLIPFYIGTDNRLTPLREKVDLLDTIRSALNGGGEIVLHGTTHQYKGITGVDSEFWDEEKGEPLEEFNYIRSRVELGLDELQAVELLSKTVGWETPHNPYRAGDKAYSFFENRFNLLYDNPHWIYDLEHLPYPLIRKNATYIQTNLGYYRQDLPIEQVESKLEIAKKISKLQYGGVVSFFYHQWLGVEKLELLINGLTEQGWEFSLASSVASEYSTIGNGG